MIGIVLISVFLITISMSYAYFTATFNNVGNRDTSITAAKVGSVRLNAEAATYTSDNQFPGEMTVQKFYIEPVGEGKGIYEIDLTGVIDESIFGSDVEISLYKAMNNEEVVVTKGELTQENDYYYRVDTLETNGLTPIYTGVFKNGLNILYQEEFEVINESGLKIRENSESTAYPKYTYYLVYNYKNNGEQNTQMGKTFSGTVSGKLIQEKTPSESHVISFVYIEPDGLCSLKKASFENHELVSWVAYDCDTLEEIGPITEGYTMMGDYSTDIEVLVDGMFYETEYYYDGAHPDALAIDDVRYLDRMVYENYYTIWDSNPTYSYNNYLDVLADYDGDLVLYHSEYEVYDGGVYSVTFINLDGSGVCQSVERVDIDPVTGPAEIVTYSCDTGEELEYYYEDLSEKINNETWNGDKIYYYNPNNPSDSIDFTDSSQGADLISEITNGEEFYGMAYREYEFHIEEHDMYTLYYIGE